MDNIIAIGYIFVVGILYMIVMHLLKIKNNRCIKGGRHSYIKIGDGYKYPYMTSIYECDKCKDVTEKIN